MQVLYRWKHIAYTRSTKSSIDYFLKVVTYGVVSVKYNYFKIISQAYCSSRIFSNMFIVAEIILK